MTQKERQERSRREIQQAALEEFGDKGYDKVTMESICTGHGISKGMMYHYYTNKDELFLLCVADTFRILKEHIQQRASDLAEHGSFENIQNFFMLREQFFQHHPKEKRIFENAVLHTPEHLAAEIQELRRPLQEMNFRFLETAIEKMPLRPGLDKGKVARHLENMGHLLQIAAQSQTEPSTRDLHTMLENIQELLDMTLYGVIQQGARMCR